MDPTPQDLERWERQARAGHGPGGDPEIDRRAIEFARRTVARIDEDPSLVRVGLTNIERWTRQRGYLPGCHAEWKELIETHPWERLREILLDESDEGQRLRSSHPFVGILSETAPHTSERGEQRAELILAAIRGETATVILRWHEIDDTIDGTAMAQELGLI